MIISIQICVDTTSCEVLIYHSDRVLQLTQDSDKTRILNKLQKNTALPYETLFVQNRRGTIIDMPNELVFMNNRLVFYDLQGFRDDYSSNHANSMYYALCEPFFANNQREMHEGIGPGPGVNKRTPARASFITSISCQLQSIVIITLLVSALEDPTSIRHSPGSTAHL